MITGLPSDFTSAIESTSRKPVQLLHFMFPGETFYLSDRSVGIIDGLEHDYLPWVESWNTMNDNALLSSVLDGSSLEIKAGTLTIICAGESKTFIRRLFQLGAENIEVHLYQWFEGMTSAPVLDDIMVCQDPINYTEVSMLVNIDLVSVLMISDKHLWPQAPGHADYPVIIGKALGVPLIDLQTARWTEMVQDMTFDATGVFFVENGVGFPASGTVSIDSEDMTYSEITASAITITARAQNGTTARPHYRGARVIPYGASYDYAICAGPVDTVDNLLGNGIAYANDVTFYPGQNPVIARFTGRPPWLRVEAGAGGDPIIPDPVTSTEYGVSTEQHYGGTASSPTSAASINAEAGAASMAIVSTVAGGAGTYTKYARDYVYNSLGGTNWTMVLGASASGGGMDVYTRAGILGDIADGAKGSIDSKYGYTETGYGSLTAVSVRVVFGVGSDIIQSHSKVRVILVAASGALTTLEEWDDNSLTRVYGDSYKPGWYNVTKNYSISVASFTDLANTRIRIEIENVESSTRAEYGLVYDRCTVDVASIEWNISYFIPAGTVPQPYQELVSHFNRDLSSLGSLSNVTVQVRTALTLVSTSVDFAIVKRSTSDPSGDTNLSSTSTSSSIADATYTYNLGTISWAALQALRVGCYHKVTAPTAEGDTRRSTVTFSWVKWVITYQPGDIETPDEQRVVYADDLICDVTSGLGADPTPPEVLEYLIDNNSPCGAFIDAASFAAAHAEYDAEGYYLNGKMEPGTRLHEALKIVLSEGMCRFLFSQGKIKLISAYATFSTTVDATIANDSVKLRSRKIEYPPTAQLVNQVTVSYGRNLTTDLYQSEYTAEDTDSITRYYLKDYRKELTLINEAASAEFWADRYLGIMSTPSAIFSLSAYMPAYPIEKGDRISIKAFFDGRITVTGQVLTISRTYGQGKNNLINLFQLQIFNPSLHGDLDLLDGVVVDDEETTLYRLGTTDAVLIEEIINLSTCSKNGYGSCGYGQFNYGE